MRVINIPRLVTLPHHTDLLPIAVSRILFNLHLSESPILQYHHSITSKNVSLRLDVCLRIKTSLYSTIRMLYLEYIKYSPELCEK